jgi:Winged helix-turn helix
MVAALIGHLLEKPDLYLDEMAWFLWDEFSVTVSPSTISRALHRARWSKKQVKYNLLLPNVYFL